MKSLGSVDEVVRSRLTDQTELFLDQFHGNDLDRDPSGRSVTVAPRRPKSFPGLPLRSHILSVSVWEL